MIKTTNNKPQESPSALTTYDVEFEFILKKHEQLTKCQIDALLNDPKVKSINIKK